MFRYQETKLALGFAWFLAPFGGAAAGFYLGTIWASDTVLDLQIGDIRFGGLTCLAGLLLGVLFAIAVTVIYPPSVARMYREMEEADHH